MYLKNLIRLLTASLFGLVLFFCSSFVQAEIVYREVEAKGYGVNQSDALVDALGAAISQVNGVRLSSLTDLRVRAETNGKIDSLNESFEKEVKKAIRGVVKSYSVVSVVKETSGQVVVSVKASIPAYQHSEQMNRFRLAVKAVLDPKISRSDGLAEKFLKSVTTELEASLTQTRKFAVIDRTYEGLTTAELNTVDRSNAPVEETVRKSQRATADYLVIIRLREFHFERYLQVLSADQRLERSRAPSLIDLRIIDISSGQVKFAKSYSHRGYMPPRRGLGGLAGSVASGIGEEINFAVYPARIVGKTADGKLSVNQGGNSLQVEREYQLYALGRDLVDPYTKESLGGQELLIGSVEIESVTDRTATARIVQGDTGYILGSKGDMILRPISHTVGEGKRGGDQHSSSTNVEEKNSFGDLKAKKAPEDW